MRISLLSETIIKNPKANFIEKEIKRLVLFKIILNNPEKKLILVDPFSFAFDTNRNIYVYDKVLKELFQFNENFNLKKKVTLSSLLKRKIKGIVLLKIGLDNLLYIFDPWGKNILALNEKLVVKKTFHNVPFLGSLAVSKMGKIYLLKKVNETLAANEVSQKVSNVFLVKKYDWEYLYLKQFGFFNITDEDMVNISLFYDLIVENKMLIFSKFDSRLIVVGTDGKLNIKHLIPERALNSYEKKLEILKKNKALYLIPLFYNVCLENQSKMLYFQHGIDYFSKENLLYQFDLNGELIHTFIFEGCDGKHINFKGKSGENFIVVENKKIKIFREE